MHLPPPGAPVRQRRRAADDGQRAGRGLPRLLGIALGLRPGADGGGLKLVNKAIDFGQAATFGDPGDISPIRIGRDDGIAITSGGTFQGRSVTGLDFYAFHAGRVVHVEAGRAVAAPAVAEVR